MCVRFLQGFGNSRPNKLGKDMGSITKDTTRSRCVRFGAGLEKILTRRFMSLSCSSSYKENDRILDVCAEVYKACEYRFDLDVIPARRPLGMIMSSGWIPDLCNNI